METDQIVEILGKNAQSAENWDAIGIALRAQVSNDQNDPLWNFVFAFNYIYVADAKSDSRIRFGPFAPKAEWADGGVYPPPLSTLNDESVALWDDVLRKSEHPLICSRLADLLWIRSWGERPDLYARQAIDSYLQLAVAERIEFEQVNSLVRALELAKELNDIDRKQAVVEATIATASKELNFSAERPGISLRLIESLMSLPKGEIPNEVNGLLDLASQVYEENTWILENIFELKTRRADAEHQKELRKAQIDKWIEEAEKESSAGIKRMADLQHALELARNYGFQEIADNVRQRIQSIPEEELGLKTISTSVEIPNEELEKFLNVFAETTDWKGSLIRFGSYGPPSGDYKKNVEKVEEESQRYPLQFLIARSIYQENNALVQVGKDLEENKAIAVVNHETMGIRIFGRFAPEILKRIIEKHGIPAADELTGFFSTQLIPTDVAENIAKSIYWYFQDEYDIAAHLLVPRLETIFRIIAREIGLVIIQEPRGNKSGGVVQLGNLLYSMQERMDESWRRYFYNVLVNPIGVNLRNRICHGLLPKATQDDASLLIHVACHLRLMQINQNQPEEVPQNES
jgi:hypothetical protein